MAESPGLGALLAEHWELAKRLRHMRIVFDVDRCKGVMECYEVCPVGCWIPDPANAKVIFQHEGRCIACGACVLQCPEQAIELR